jgi:predicted helicase
MQPFARPQHLTWPRIGGSGLRAPLPDEPHTCRILTNAKCLSEGVDIPDLDAVLFLNPRNSIVDVVQSVGRVMRLAEGKEYGYVILPVVIPASMKPEDALRDNNKFRVVWQVLQALRAHDDRFNAMVNKIELNRARDDRTQVIGVGSFDSNADSGGQTLLPFPEIAEWRDAIYAKMVQKVGDRRYWETWAQDVAAIAERNTARIRALLSDEASDIHLRFQEFVAGLRATLNDSITADDAINMLSQHLITRPVFEALFADYSFADSNPVSIAMQAMVDALDAQNVAAETETLEPFYQSVRQRAAGIDNAEGKQRIIAELYERFFKTAFPQVAQSLGIVYTPVELVDFIINSVQTVLRSEFGASLADEGVHVLDPFTGTGTFLVRLLQSGLIAPDALRHKYRYELHANEIVLLAYYIAAINIEAAYHDLVADTYLPFPGVVLADTFQMYEHGDTLDERLFPQNNERVHRQKAADIRVIIANPPYSVGQTSQNEGNQNLRYPSLDAEIEATYAARSTAGLKRNLYDSYIRAFRYASDRLKDRGIVCFVSNGAFIDSGSADGFRKTLADEFATIYCFNLRGNQRTSGETSRAEGGKIFGQGSRTPIAITLLVKNPAAPGPCRVHYYDIGDYLTREQKLEIIRRFGSVDSIPWELVTPDASGDWINLRNELYESFLPLGEGKGTAAGGLFTTYSLGVVTNRDAWAYNFSRNGLLANMERMIAVFNQQVAAFAPWASERGEERSSGAVDRFIDRDPAHISWTVNLKEDLRKSKLATSHPNKMVRSMYRPFCKQWLYFDRQFNERVLQIPKLFPTAGHGNLVIETTGIGASRPFSALITDSVPNLHLLDTGQCFPLYLYEQQVGDADLFDSEASSGYVRRDAVSDRALATYRLRYGMDVTKEDIFYYVYGILHSPEYRSRFVADLKKMVPRIPMVEAFAAFSAAGRDLAQWHVGYETIDPWPLGGMPQGQLTPAQTRVTKMRFGKLGKDDDPTTIVFNSTITLLDIPVEAYDYEVNGKSAIEWIMDRYQVTTDKDSGILNDPNSWSEDPRYVLDLVARIVRVSMETVRIVKALPPLGDLVEGEKVRQVAGHTPWADVVGPVYTTDQVRELLGGATRQAIADRVEQRTLLCLTTRDEHRVYPAFQFANRVVVPGLNQVLTRLVDAVDDWTLASWLRAGQPELGGASVMDRLTADGRAEEAVLRMAENAAERWGR